MPAISFSKREFVEKINEMDVFTSFRPHRDWFRCLKCGKKFPNKHLSKLHQYNQHGANGYALYDNAIKTTRFEKGDIITCFYKQRAKKICENCLNFSQIDEIGNGWCKEDERAFAENTCDDFNKIICKAEVITADLATLSKSFFSSDSDIPTFFLEIGNSRYIFNGWDDYPIDSDLPLSKIARLDKFNSVEKFFNFFDENYELPMLFDRFAFRKLDTTKC